MKKYITDEHTGLKYELVGDYYLIVGDEEPEHESLGIWGQRHCNYLCDHKHAIYSGLLVSGKLDSYLRDIDWQAADMLSRLMTEMAQCEGVTEELKSENQTAWVGAMNSIRQRASEIVNTDLIFV